MIECRVVKNASTGDDICGKVVRIVSGADGARGPGGKSGDDSSDQEDAIKPKKQGLIIIALKRVIAMAEGQSQEGRQQHRRPNKGSSGPIRAVVAAQ